MEIELLLPKGPTRSENCQWRFYKVSTFMYWLKR